MLAHMNRSLLARLRERNVQIETPDGDTLVLRRVPIHPDFNKPHTNLLLMRTGKADQPCIACVDEDLAYRGADQCLAQVFAAGPRRSGWRVLSMGSSAVLRPDVALDVSLAALGFCGVAPRSEGLAHGDRHREQRLLGRFAQDLTARLHGAAAFPAIGRSEETEQLAGCVCGWGPARLGLIMGESGVGKTHLLHSLARFLAERRPDLQVLRVDTTEVLAGVQADGQRQLVVMELINEAVRSPGTVLAVERLDYLLAGGEPIEGLISRGLDRGLRLVGTALPGTLRWTQLPQLWRRTQVVRLGEPSTAAAQAILAAWKARLEAHHGVQIADHVLGLAARLAQGLPGRLPAKAIDLLDHAAATAALQAATVLSPDDVATAVRNLAAKQGEDDGSKPDEGYEDRQWHGEQA